MMGKHKGKPPKAKRAGGCAGLGVVVGFLALVALGLAIVAFTNVGR